MSLCKILTDAGQDTCVLILSLAFCVACLLLAFTLALQSLHLFISLSSLSLFPFLLPFLGPDVGLYYWPMLC